MTISALAIPNFIVHLEVDVNFINFTIITCTCKSPNGMDQLRILHLSYWFFLVSS